MERTVGESHTRSQLQRFELRTGRPLTIIYEKKEKKTIMGLPIMILLLHLSSLSLVRGITPNFIQSDLLAGDPIWLKSANSSKFVLLRSPDFVVRPATTLLSAKVNLL